MVCFQYRFDFIANFNRIKNPKPAISPSQIDHSNKKILGVCQYKYRFAKTYGNFNTIKVSDKNRNGTENIP